MKNSIQTQTTPPPVGFAQQGATDYLQRQDALRSMRRLEALLESFLKITPREITPRAEEKFFSLPREVQMERAKEWEALANFIEGALEEGLDIFDEVKMLCYAFDRLGLIRDTAILSNIQRDDVVEIYGPDYVQIYRSFTYFSLCNYSLLELSAYPWFELYERSSQIFKDLFSRTEPVLRGEVAQLDFKDYPEYTIKETMSTEGAVFSIQEKRAYRILSAINGQSYLLSVKKVRELSSSTPSDGHVRFI